MKTKLPPIEEALDQGVWAVAISPHARYIGQLWGIDSSHPSDASYFVSQLTLPIIIRYPLELLTIRNSVDLPAEPDLPVRPVWRGCMLIGVPVAHCLDVEQMQIYATPLDLVLFQDMSDEDCAVHKEVVRRGIKEARELRQHQQLSKKGS